MQAEYSTAVQSGRAARPERPPGLGAHLVRAQRSAEVGLDQGAQSRRNPTAAVRLPVNQQVADPTLVEPQDGARTGKPPANA